MLRDVDPVEFEDVGDSSADGGDDAATEVAELEAELDRQSVNWWERASKDSRGIGDLRAEWTPEDLAAAEAAGHPRQLDEMALYPPSTFL